MLYIIDNYYKDSEDILERYSESDDQMYDMKPTENSCVLIHRSISRNIIVNAAPNKEC